MWKRLAACAALASLALVAAPAPARSQVPSMEASFVALVNGARAAQGLAPLASHSNLTAKARSWSQTMASRGSIGHSTLAEGVTVAWDRIGENVGTGPSVDAVHAALMASASHRANILDPGFDSLGVGVVVTPEGALYVTEVFLDSPGAPAPPPAPAPAPAAAPAPPAVAAPAPAPAPDPEPVPASTGRVRTPALRADGTDQAAASEPPDLPDRLVATLARVRHLEDA